MGILGKFFGFKDETDTEELPIEQNEQRKAVRIGGSLINDIFFEIPIEGNQGNIKIQIANLSTTGLLLMGGQFDIPDEVVGKIGFNQNNMQVKIKVVRKDSYMFGVKVIEPIQEFANFMNSIFEMEFAAAQASIVPADKLKEVEHGEPHWIISRTGHSVYFVTEGEGKEEINNYSIHLGQHLIERKSINTESGGSVFKVYLIDDEKRKEMFYKGSDLLKTSEPTYDIYHKAKNLVLAIRGLEDEQRQFLQMDLYKAFRPFFPEDKI